VSPGTAASIAACRFPPAGTTRVAPEVAEATMKKIKKMTQALIILGEKQRRAAAKTWEITILTPLNDCRDM
jgi:hypothetical protein